MSDGKVTIVGAGIAGMRAALEIDSRLNVVMATKDRVQLSNSAWAQGHRRRLRSGR